MGALYHQKMPPIVAPMAIRMGSTMKSHLKERFFFGFSSYSS
jgi:hypothetical protein